MSLKPAGYLVLQPADTGTVTVCGYSAEYLHIKQGDDVVAVSLDSVPDLIEALNQVVRDAQQ